MNLLTKIIPDKSDRINSRETRVFLHSASCFGRKTIAIFKTYQVYTGNCSYFIFLGQWCSSTWKHIENAEIWHNQPSKLYLKKQRKKTKSTTHFLLLWTLCTHLLWWYCSNGSKFSHCKLLGTKHLANDCNVKLSYVTHAIQQHITTFSSLASPSLFSSLTYTWCADVQPTISTQSPLSLFIVHLLKWI